MIEDTSIDRLTLDKKNQLQETHKKLNDKGLPTYCGRPPYKSPTASAFLRHGSQYKTTAIHSWIRSMFTNIYKVPRSHAELCEAQNNVLRMGIKTAQSIPLIWQPRELVVKGQPVCETELNIHVRCETELDRHGSTKHLI